eukprot:2430433-Rhodomonas_salina.1
MQEGQGRRPCGRQRAAGRARGICSATVTAAVTTATVSTGPTVTDAGTPAHRSPLAAAVSTRARSTAPLRTRHAHNTS